MHSIIANICGIITKILGKTSTKSIYTKSGQNATGIYNIPSNDPDESQLSCDILGNYDGVNVGMTAPDFTMPIIANGTGNFNLNYHWSNAGEIVVISFFSPG